MSPRSHVGSADPRGSAVLLSTVDDLSAGAGALAAEHEVFAELYEANGVPPLWRREPTFATMVRFILEQQVSLASANAAFSKLETRIGVVEPAAVLSLTDAQLREDGFSRQKTSYIRGIADDVLTGTVGFDAIAADPSTAETRLLAMRGVGPWTTACFRLFVIGEADVWPSGDRALHVAMAKVLELDAVPDTDTAARLAEPWAPWRSVAARMLWHDYLGGVAYDPDSIAGFT